MYTAKIKSPVYEIKGEKPRLVDLVDTTFADKLVEEIDSSIAPEGIKSFLRKAASRHNKFNYAKVAEYYANASPGVQELFEKSGLVIIDFDSAIENGFISMNKQLMEIRKNEPTPQE